MAISLNPVRNNPAKWNFTFLIRISNGVKCPKFWGQNILTIVTITGILFGAFFPWAFRASPVKSDLTEISIPENLDKLAVIEGNSLLPLSQPANPEPEIIQKIPVVITAYSSSPWETDSSPYLTAAGTWVRKGIVANNKFPFGTKIRIPEIYGDKIFVVEDRMNRRKSNYHIDIWFPHYWQALNFGVKRTYIEVLES
jgi:3D (Asp-Asp-Asp) domain-containing protein